MYQSRHLCTLSFFPIYIFPVGLSSFIVISVKLFSDDVFRWLLMELLPMTTPNTWPQKKKLELTAIMCAPPPRIEITVCFSHAQEDLFFPQDFRGLREICIFFWDSMFLTVENCLSLYYVILMAQVVEKEKKCCHLDAKHSLSQGNPLNPPTFSSSPLPPSSAVRLADEPELEPPINPLPPPPHATPNVKSIHTNQPIIKHKQETPSNTHLSLPSSSPFLFFPKAQPEYAPLPLRALG